MINYSVEQTGKNSSSLAIVFQHLSTNLEFYERQLNTFSTLISDTTSELPELLGVWVKSIAQSAQSFGLSAGLNRAPYFAPIRAREIGPAQKWDCGPDSGRIWARLYGHNVARIAP